MSLSPITTASLTPNANSAAVPEPKISCVIPAYNEAANLRILIPLLTETLAGLSRRAEIIVVDDGSSDDTAATAAALTEHYPVK